MTTRAETITAAAPAAGLPPEIIAAAEGMPSLSPVLGKINQMAREMETSPRDLVRVIMLDPTLTAQVLKLVNSSFYGLAQRVSSLAQAVVLLGMNTVKNIAVSTALLSTVYLRDRRSPIPPDAFWRHCLGVAVACRMLARSRGADAETGELYFIAGLLHDIGKILFVRADAERYSRAILESRDHGVCLWFAEMAHFGCTHMESGALLARTWNLDASLAQVIECHHRRDRAPVLPAAAAAVANNFCKQSRIGDCGDSVVEELPDEIVLRFGALDEVTGRLAAVIPDEINRAAAFLCPTQERMPV